MSSKSNLELLSSAARTATPTIDNSAAIGDFAKHITDIHIIVDVTLDPGTASLQPALQGFDTASGKWYDLIASITAIASTGTTNISFGQNTPVVANGSNTGFLPAIWRFTITAADAESITYSVGMNYSIED